MRHIFPKVLSAPHSARVLLTKFLLWFALSLALSFVVGGALAILTACTPAWSDSEVETEPPVELSFQPQAAIDAVAPITRIRIHSAVDVDGLHFVRGDVGPHTLSKLAQGEPSASLRDRAVEHVRWQDAEGRTVVAPSSALEQGQVYTLANASPPWAQSFAVLAEDLVPTLALVWPPSEGSEAAHLAVWCAKHPLAIPGQQLVVHPSLSASLASGSGSMGWGPACVHLRRNAPVEPITPPLLTDAAGRAIARLEPRERVANAQPTVTEPLHCAPTEQNIGPGCARVMDDRALIRGPAYPLLWTLQVDTQTHVLAQSAGQSFALFGLRSSSPNAISFQVQDASGQEHGATTTLYTEPPRAHVVITEVFANPLGPEPQQEWVELFNDGSVAAQLDGWRLRDVGGDAELPSVTLGPGLFALIVRDDYDASGKYDAAPTVGTYLLRVPQLGKNGLSNAGEPLELVDSGGQIASAFTGDLEPKAGRSVIRIWPAAPDDSPESFALNPNDPSPGALP